MIKITTNNPKVDKHIKKLEKRLKKHKGKLIICTDRYVTNSDDDQKEVGYFTEDKDNLEIVVATRYPLRRWLSTLLHEESHLDQLLDKEPTSKALELPNGDCALMVVWTWIDGKPVPYKGKELRHCFNLARNMELDCERRTLAKIEEDFSDIIDPIWYAQAASAYIYFYNFMYQNRTWYNINKKRLSNKDILALMPSDLNGNYTRNPPGLNKLFKECV